MGGPRELRLALNERTQPPRKKQFVELRVDSFLTQPLAQGRTRDSRGIERAPMRSQAPTKESSNAVIHLSRRQPSRLHPSLKRARGNVHWQSLVHGVCARQALEQGWR